ncbi:MAG: signal peptidase I [Planctomycetota bacterium]
MTTFILIAALFVLLCASLILWAWLLAIGLRWVKAEVVTVSKLAGATLLTSCANIGVTIASSFVAELSPLLEVILAVAELVFNLMITFWIIGYVFKLSTPRAAKAWLPTLAGPIVMVGLAFFVLRPFVIEAFAVPTNSMAPTILGRHLCSACPECGANAFASAWRTMAYDTNNWICEDNFHTNEFPAESEQVEHEGDRILVAKYLRPRRWDLVVFRYPEDPSQTYIKRLVGLPGETVTIKGGEIYADGNLVRKPESIHGIYYESEMGYDQIWGSEDRPATLGDDEYFVLGDFSLQAKDSRLWYDGAPGHSPYAVPASYMKGVATHIYWPPSRWCLFR